MWCCTGGTGMICKSFATTRHYREEHNMDIEKRDRSDSKSNAALREYISPHERT